MRHAGISFPSASTATPGSGKHSVTSSSIHRRWVTVKCNSHRVLKDIELGDCDSITVDIGNRAGQLFLIKRPSVPLVGTTIGNFEPSDIVGRATTERDNTNDRARNT